MADGVDNQEFITIEPVRAASGAPDEGIRRDLSLSIAEELMFDRFSFLRTMLRSASAITIGACALIALSAPARAEVIWNFTFSGTFPNYGPHTGQSDNIAGQLTTTDLNAANNTYTITGMTGMDNGSEITGLDTQPYNDNLLYATMPYLDFNGFTFTTAAGDIANLYYNASSGHYWDYFDNGATLVENGTFAVSQAAAPVPEPASIALLGAGLLLFSVLGRKRKAHRSIRRFMTVVPALILFAAVGTMAEAASLYDTTVLANNPVAFFPLNEPSGSTANNASHAAGAQNGTYNNVTLGIPGTPDGTGGAYNGTNSYVSVPNYAALDVTNDFSIEAWVNVSGPAANSLDTIFSINRGADGTGLAFALEGDTPELSINNNATNFNTTAGGKVTPGMWNQVDVTYNGADVDFYINGSFAGATAFTQTLALSQTLPLTLGVEFPNGFLGGRYFNGDIGDVSFYNTALTAQQVQANFAASAPEPASLLLMGAGCLLLAGFRPIKCSLRGFWKPSRHYPDAS